MRRSKEELGRIHKEKCRELKQIRAKMAADLGVELHQRECTYQGYCSGTCPKCMQEEMMLNAAIMRKQLEESGLKQRVAAAGLTTAAAVCLSGCNTGDVHQLEGDVQYIPDETLESVEGEIIEPDLEVLEGAIALPESTEAEIPETEETECTVMELEGDIAYLPTEWELAGEMPIYEEATSEEME